MTRRAPTYLRQPGDGEGLMPRQVSIILHLGSQSAIMQHHDLATDKDGGLPSKPEESERADLMKVIRRCQKPIALFID